MWSRDLRALLVRMNIVDTERSGLAAEDLKIGLADVVTLPVGYAFAVERIIVDDDIAPVPLNSVDALPRPRFFRAGQRDVEQSTAPFWKPRKVRVATFVLTIGAQQVAAVVVGGRLEVRDVLIGVELRVALTLAYTAMLPWVDPPASFPTASLPVAKSTEHEYGAYGESSMVAIGFLPACTYSMIFCAPCR